MSGYFLVVSRRAGWDTALPGFYLYTLMDYCHCSFQLALAALLAAALLLERPLVCCSVAALEPLAWTVPAYYLPVRDATQVRWQTESLMSVREVVVARSLLMDWGWLASVSAEAWSFWAYVASYQ